MGTLHSCQVIVVAHGCLSMTMEKTFISASIFIITSDCEDLYFCIYIVISSDCVTVRHFSNQWHIDKAIVQL